MFKNYLCYKFAKAVLPVFRQYPLHPQILDILDKKGIHTATPVQDMLFNCDNKLRLLIGPTGTGKTYAYMLPIIGKLKQEEEEQKQILTQKNRPRALVIVSTKELADQVEDVSQEFTKPLKLSTLSLGKGTFKQEQSILNNGVDLVFSTLERLQRHRHLQSLYLSKVSHCVVDEIDTLLDASMQEEIKKLANYFKETDSSVTYCGATYSTKVRNFIERMYKKDISILIEKSSHMHLENLSHDFIHCTTLDKSEPFLALYKECQNKFKGSMIIFCNEITSAHFLEFLCKRNGIKTVSLHGDLPKGMRTQNVAEFRSQQCKILITTDLGARGLDFPFVDAIINFDFPKSTSDYLHRAGRAGRAGRKGFIYSLYHSKESQVIEELKRANEGDRPIRIEESAYSKANKEDTPKEKQQTNANEKKEQKHKHYVKGYKPPQRQEKQERTKSKKYFQKVHDGEI